MHTDRPLSAWFSIQRVRCLRCSLTRGKLCLWLLLVFQDCQEGTGAILENRLILNHLVLVTVGGAQRWVWGLFGRQPGGFWSPMRTHMGPARSSFSDLSMVVLGLPTDPSFHEWLFSMAASFLSLCLPSPLIQMPYTPSLSQLFQPSSIISLSATWQRPTRFVTGQTFN